MRSRVTHWTPSLVLYAKLCPPSSKGARVRKPQPTSLILLTSLNGLLTTSRRGSRSTRLLSEARCLTTPRCSGGPRVTRSYLSFSEIPATREPGTLKTPPSTPLSEPRVKMPTDSSLKRTSGEPKSTTPQPMGRKWPSIVPVALPSLFKSSPGLDPRIRIRRHRS